MVKIKYGRKYLESKLYNKILSKVMRRFKFHSYMAVAGLCGECISINSQKKLFKRNIELGYIQISREEISVVCWKTRYLEYFKEIAEAIKKDISKNVTLHIGDIM